MLYVARFERINFSFQPALHIVEDVTFESDQELDGEPVRDYLTLLDVPMPILDQELPGYSSVMPVSEAKIKKVQRK
jgi:hypothetical protein